MNIFFGVHFTDEKNCRLHFKEKIFSRFLITLLIVFYLHLILIKKI
jgi:hypothetical protein